MSIEITIVIGKVPVEGMTVVDTNDTMSMSKTNVLSVLTPQSLLA